MKNNHILLRLSLVLLSACTPAEPLINSFVDEWRLLVADDGGVTSVSMPKGETLATDVWSGPTGVAFPVSSISGFREYLYLLHATQPWIVILESKGLVAVDTIDLGTGGIATDIAFANATTAYVTLPSSKGIGIIDLTVGSLVRTIDCGGTPAGIAAVGNQVCFSITDLNEVAVLDSRTNEIGNRRSVGRAPVFVEADQLNAVFCIVSLGAGKIDQEIHTPPTIAFMTASNGTIVKTLEVSGRPTNAAMQVPRGLIVNANEFAFVPVQNGLVTVNTRTRNKTSVIQFESYDAIAYNGARAEILVQRRIDGQTIINALDEYGETIRSTVERADSSTALFGIGP